MKITPLLLNLALKLKDFIIKVPERKKLFISFSKIY